jgi:hypothetical protein
VFGIFKLIFLLGAGTVKFLFSHVLGTIFGALIGLLLGRKHIGVKIFSHKKHVHEKKHAKA